MEKLTLHELSKRTDWQKAVVVFTEDSWDREYSELSRSYEISSNAKYFNPNAIGSSLFGDCLDGMDNDVRLDRYMYGSNGRDGWEIDYCYIKK